MPQVPTPATTPAPATDKTKDNGDNAKANQKSDPSSDGFKIVEVTNDGNIIYEDQINGQSGVLEGQAVLNEIDNKSYEKFKKQIIDEGHLKSYELRRTYGDGDPMGMGGDINYNINDDIVVESYLKEKYKIYQNTGKINVGSINIEINNIGELLIKFKAKYPSVVKGIKYTADLPGQGLEMLLDIVLYPFEPFKPAWDAYSDFVNEYIVPDFVKAKVNEAGLNYEDWKKGLTEQEKAVLDDTTYTLGKVADAYALKTLLQKVGELAITDSAAKKVFTKTDTPHHKTHTENTGHKIGSDLNKVKIGSDAGGGYKHSIEVDIKILEKNINLPTDYNNAKLRKKFDSHKEDFGMKGVKFNKDSADLFKIKITEHVKHPDTIAIAAKYRGEKTIHYYNHKTKINVMKDMDGNFVSGWEMYKNQINKLKINGDFS